MHKLAIVGSRAYTNKSKMMAIIENYRNEYPGFTIVSGGCPKGADFLAKEIAMELGINYQEFPPAHARYNEYCVLEPHNYGKSYDVNNFFDRNTKIAEHCDHLIAFVVKDVVANGTMDTVTKARKLNKHVNVHIDE
jgi:hypothetical protein